MLNEYRARHANASEYAHVMTRAMWESTAALRLSILPPKDYPQHEIGPGEEANMKM
jgi:hypothetical protein